jgi:hypothetical protein
MGVFSWEFYNNQGDVIFLRGVTLKSAEGVDNRVLDCFGRLGDVFFYHTSKTVRAEQVVNRYSRHKICLFGL